MTYKRKRHLDYFGVPRKDRSKRIQIVRGNLFENIHEKADLIVFNQPFFGDKPKAGDTIDASMLNDGELVGRFLAQAPNYLKKNGVIMMPFYSKAGKTNDPVIQGPKHGFKVETTFRTTSTSGLQTGEITVHELRLKH